MRSLIRLAAFVAPLLILTPLYAQEVKPSGTACDSHRIGARELADCLKAAADKSEHDLASQVEICVKWIETRVGLMSAQKSRWKRSLNEAEAQWLTWRDSECQDVAPFEAGMGAKGGDPRLACMIDANAKRIADLKARYQ